MEKQIINEIYRSQAHILVYELFFPCKLPSPFKSLLKIYSKSIKNAKLQMLKTAAYPTSVRKSCNIFLST